MTAWGDKLLWCLEVRQLILLYHSPDGSLAYRLCLVLSFHILWALRKLEEDAKDGAGRQGGNWKATDEVDGGGERGQIQIEIHNLWYFQGVRVTFLFTSAMATCSTISMPSAPWMVVLSDCKTRWRSLLKVFTISLSRSPTPSIIPLNKSNKKFYRTFKCNKVDQCASQLNKNKKKREIEREINKMRQWQCINIKTK